jgi:hypothetical protein
MRVVALLSGVIAVSLAAATADAIEPSCRVIPQPDAPVQLSEYSCEYTSGSGRYSTGAGIRHSLKYAATMDSSPVVAVQVGLVSFDVFNEFIGRLGGVAIEDLAPGAGKEGTWVQRVLSDFAFQTGLAYVSKVRFANDTVWSADQKAILTALRQIEADFEDADLRERRGGATPPPGPGAQ